MARNEREPASPLEAGPDHTFNESQWFWWSDPEQKISGFHRIAHQPNRQNAHIWNAIIDDTGRYTRRVSSSVSYTPDMRADGKYSVEGLTFSHLDQGGLAVTADQDNTQLDLTFTDLHRAVSFDEIVSKEEAEEMHGNSIGGESAGHMEAAGRVEGQLTIDGRAIDFAGHGHRDHSWGARSVSDIQCSTWCNGTIGHDFSFFVTAGTIYGTPPQKVGYIAEGDLITPIKEWRLYPWMDIDGVTYVRVTGYVETTDGRRFDLELSELMGATITTLDDLFLCETAFNLTVNGEHRGVANMERGINPSAGQRLPSPAINAIYEDGVGNLSDLLGYQ